MRLFGSPHAAVAPLAATAALLLLLLIGPSSASAADPITCAGYPQSRVFLESQSWWSDSRGLSEGDSSHAHSGACFPVYQTISGSLTLDIRSMIHNEPIGTRLTAVRIQGFQNGVGAQTLAQKSPSLLCDSRDCTFWTTLTADLSSLQRRGQTEFRIHTETTRPDGSKQLATNGWLAYVTNDKPLSGSSAVRFPQTEGRGWYRTASGTVLGYENALLRSPVPTTPVCGVWSFKVQSKAGSGGEAVTSTLVTLDPNFHAGFRGTVLHESSSSTTQQLSVDTRLLANGPHKLVIAAKADELVDARLAGVQVIPFKVDNTLACLASEVTSMFPPGATISGDPATTTDAVLDAFAPGATKVEYWVDGSRVASDSTAPDFDEFWDINSIAGGAHTLVSKALVGGRLLESPPVAFTVGS